MLYPQNGDRIVTIDYVTSFRFTLCIRQTAQRGVYVDVQISSVHSKRTGLRNTWECLQRKNSVRVL